LREEILFSEPPVLQSLEARGNYKITLQKEIVKGGVKIFSRRHSQGFRKAVLQNTFLYLPKGRESISSLKTKAFLQAY
jgi:hypothetical protein